MAFDSPPLRNQDSPSLQSPDTALSGQDITRVMPHALGPEKSILSSMLKDPEQWIGLSLEEGLTRDHFYLPGHGLLFETLRDLNAKGTVIELVSLVQLLHDRGILDNVGGPGAITEIFTYAPNAAHFHNHLALVKDKQVLRSIIRTCTEAVSEAFENPEETNSLLDRVESSVLNIRQGNESTRGFHIKQSVIEVINNFEALLAGDVNVQGAPTGYVDLDRMCKGLKPGEMFVVAARPSMGKTSFMMNVAEHICIDQGVPSMIFSCEMTAFQIVQRLVFSRARFALSQIGRGFSLKKEDLIRIKRASEEVASAKMFVDDTPGILIDTLRAKARRRKREDNIGFIAIDYLQLLKSGSKQAQNSREREIGEISAGIKGLAKELGIPILVLAQLNRGPEGRTGKSLGVPRMSDLRESGTIEQDADMIGLLYRTAYYAETEEEKESEAGKAELVLAKNRNGETGHVPLTFIAELMRFETRARDDNDQH
ncbi:MAG: replicative DNA helicase [Verrucomicrobia bacterium]|nr:MAG: replicative DNA helicase [Verrucomicrobiota bacterium]TAE89400.1 MAG: replicative DNA helicase [Verrucomicrobiota bacterium]TAF28100.1 MAG: replicative DNA helicase [Verrucomicrobiota bacterium]TAF42948.1 MAG: replicative DNA helicase [Verrucomicrobiota bacterium]